MKNYVLLSMYFSLLIHISLSQESSPLKNEEVVSAKEHRINFSFTWLEGGVSIPLREKKLSELPHGMNSYMYHPKKNLSIDFFGMGLYYRNHWGISTIFSFQEFSVPSTRFENHIASQYPNHIAINSIQAHAYSIFNINYRLSYRFHKGNFTVEPIFQFGFDNQKEADTYFVLKEKGSNDFIEYSIKKANKKKRIISIELASRFAGDLQSLNGNGT